MNAHKTAIPRTRPPAPMRFLALRGLITGRALDYGSGRSGPWYNETQYDPHYHPDLPEGKFDTITCTYVLNVIPDPQDREEIVEKIRALLTPGGTAYITIRADKKALTGVTSKGTWQGFTPLNEPVFHKEPGKWIMYKIAQRI